MSTTTIRLPSELKQRIARLAETSGTSAHAFILQAIAEKTEYEERRQDFHALANDRLRTLLESGQSVPWEDMRNWLKQRMTDSSAPKPEIKRQD